MVYTEMAGRCGNQMFRYAASRTVGKLHDEEMCLNFYQVLLQSKSDETWKNNLEEFCVKNYIQENSSKALVYKYGNLLQKFVWTLCRALNKNPFIQGQDLYRVQEKIQPMLNKMGIYYLNRGYATLQKSYFKNQFLCGTFEDKRFFDGVRDELLNELKEKGVPPKENEMLYKTICDSDAVCVSFRRGDFVKGSEKISRDICSQEYYEKAIKKMKELLPDAKFFFFSDDIEWVKKNCDFGVESYYESGKDAIAEKMRLMSSCKHFIMSNSTFCWWAQYLSRNPKKLVVSPNRWFNIPGYEKEMLEEGWILIEC